MAGFPRILKNPCASMENRFPKLYLPTVYQWNRRAKLAVNTQTPVRGRFCHRTGVFYCSDHMLWQGTKRIQLDPTGRRQKAVPWLLRRLRSVQHFMNCPSKKHLTPAETVARCFWFKIHIYTTVTLCYTMLVSISLLPTFLPKLSAKAWKETRRFDKIRKSHLTFWWWNGRKYKDLRQIRHF